MNKVKYMKSILGIFIALMVLSITASASNIKLERLSITKEGELQKTPEEVELVVINENKKNGEIIDNIILEAIVEANKEKRLKDERNNVNNEINDNEDTKVLFRHVDESLEKNLSNEKKAEIEEYEEAGEKDFGVYIRPIQEILGELSKTDKRITLKQAKEIIQSKDFKTALGEITSIHQYPDFVGGSGVTIQEYWLNRDGTELLFCILEQEQIYYRKRNSHSETQYSELLTK